MNTRDGLGSLQPFEARLLRNWIPNGNAVERRNGHALFSTGQTGAVTTLYAYDGLTASQLIGINAGDVYNFSAATATSIANSNYTTNTRWIAENYKNRLIAVAAGETPFTYDGTNTAATGFTGPTLTTLANIAKVRNRLWFCATSQADVYYGGLGAITGALTTFQLSQVVSGGTCMAIGAHSQDAGDGPDDFTVFVMSTGEVVVYSGDPSATFTKVGNFMMPEPVGRRCLVNIGGQLAVITRMGLVPLSAAFQGIAFDALAIGPFGKVSPSLQDDVRLYGSLAGWQMVLWNGAVIINVPTVDGVTSRQWYFNTLTGAWTQLGDLPISCMAVWAGNLYFGKWGTGGVVHKYTGYLDVAAAISLIARGAFSPTGGTRAIASMCRFDMRVDGLLQGKFGLDVDFGQRALTTPTETLAASTVSTDWGAAWGSQWASSDEFEGQWFSTEGEGRRFAVAMEASAQAETLQWYSTDILLEPGGLL